MESIIQLAPEQIISNFPTDRNTSLMSDMDFYIVMATELSFRSLEGIEQVLKNGDVVKNPVTLSPLPAKQVISDYFKSRGWIKANKTANTGSEKTLSEFSRNYEERTGTKAMGTEFFASLNKHTATVKDFDYYK